MGYRQVVWFATWHSWAIWQESDERDMAYRGRGRQVRVGKGKESDERGRRMQGVQGLRSRFSIWITPSPIDPSAQASVHTAYCTLVYNASHCSPHTHCEVHNVYYACFHTQYTLFHMLSVYCVLQTSNTAQMVLLFPEPLQAEMHRKLMELIRLND